MAEHSSYTIRDAMREADQALQMARDKRNAAHMIAAITLKARLAGLLVERTSVTYTSFDDLTDAELESLIADAEGSGDAGELMH